MTSKNEAPVRALEMPIALLKLVQEQGSFSQLLLSDEYLFGTYFIAAFQPIIESPLLENEDAGPTVKAFMKNVTERLNSEAQDVTGDHEKLRALVQDLQRQYGADVSANYAKNFFVGILALQALDEMQAKNPKEYLLGKLAEECSEFAKQLDHFNFMYTINISRLASLLRLTRADEEVLKLSFFNQDIEVQIFLNTFFRLLKQPAEIESALITMLIDHDKSITEKEARDALSEKSLLILSGLVHYDQRSKRLSSLGEFWSLAIAQLAKTTEDFFGRFVEPIKKKRNAGSLARLGERETKILEQALDLPCEPGLNIMMYGPSRLDKIGFIVDLLERNSKSGWTIKTQATKTSDIPAICFIAQRYLEQMHPTDILVITNASAALSNVTATPSWMMSIFGEDRGGKSADSEELESDERLLLENPVKTIWLTTSASSITTENVGRFLYHAELKGGSREDRRNEIKTHATELGLSDTLIQKLAKHSELGKEQIGSAAKLTSLFMNQGHDHDHEELFSHVVEHSQKALGRKKIEELRDSATKYDINMINLESKFTLAQMIDSLKKRPYLSLCLFGPPGTGKTAFAEHLAIELDLPIIKKRASDLLSKYVGESEQNIAAAFQEARDEGAILLFDEADSFLRDRRAARYSWETTQVNELLQQMENHTGIFICATNLMDKLDPAALRRFTFKLNFRELTIEQRVKMFENESQIILSELPESESTRIADDLTMIRFLTPGDFAVVKKQMTLFDTVLDADGWIAQLRSEVKAKMTAEGFINYSDEEGREMMKEMMQQSNTPSER